MRGGHRPQTSVRIAPQNPGEGAIVPGESRTVYFYPVKYIIIRSVWQPLPGINVRYSGRWIGAKAELTCVIIKLSIPLMNLFAFAD